jgi:hypothetical protein
VQNILWNLIETLKLELPLHGYGKNGFMQRNDERKEKQKQTLKTFWRASYQAET